MQVDIQINSTNKNIPNQQLIERWISIALYEQHRDAEVSILIVDEKEGTELNKQWRYKNYATNVLSFPANLPSGIELNLLGDLVICVSVLEREALEQNKTIYAHWAHILIHGTLHLLGYDHASDQDAIVMEKLEIKLLKQLGFDNPYETIT